MSNEIMLNAKALKKIEEYKEAYKKAFPEWLKKTQTNPKVPKREKQKWVAVKHFQNNWNPGAADFGDMLGKCLSVDPMLIGTRDGHPTDEIVRLAKARSNDMKKMFSELFEDSENPNDYVKRVMAFQNKVVEIGGSRILQNKRVISKYLWLHNPKLYYIYKEEELDAANEILGTGCVRFRRNRDMNETLNNFLSFSKELNEELKKDPELKQLLKDNLTDDCDKDEELHTLTYDFIHFLAKTQAEKKSEDSNDKGDSEMGNNKIWFGAPGTGKSYNLKQKLDNLIGDNNTEQYERVTFYPDYSYANFVGTYKPVSKGDGKIDYEYVPGPFIRVLEKSLNDKSNPYVLVIEEINRANAAAVFGDMFQLLDRDKDGKSEYEVRTSEDLKKYLVKEAEKERLPKDDNYSSIRIPSNMYIWATMNSADQGVFPMDTAFKRRWEFEYVRLDDGNTEDDFKISCPEKEYNWSEVRKKINDWLLSHGINEDKCLGFYFVKKTEADTDESIKKKINEKIKYKVLMYLFEDAARMKRKELFEKNSFSEICDAYDKEGFAGVFKNGAIKFEEKPEDHGEPSDAE